MVKDSNCCWTTFPPSGQRNTAPSPWRPSAKEILADGRRELSYLPVGKGDAVVKCLPLLPGCAWKRPRVVFTTWPTLVRDGYLVGGLLLVHVVSSHWFTLHRRLGHRASPSFGGWAPRQASAPALGAFRFQWVVQKRPEESSEPLGFSFMYTEGRCQAGGIKSRGLAARKTRGWRRSGCPKSASNMATPFR